MKKRQLQDTHFKIRINTEELNELKALATKLDVSVTDLFREGARQLAIKERRKLKGVQECI